MKPTFYAIAVLALSSAAFLPVQSMAQVRVGIVIGNAPPPVRVERIPAPRHGYIWAPGYWNWDGHHHVWLSGHWEAERVGYVYQQPEWVQDNGGWRMNEGGWVSGAPQPSNGGWVDVGPAQGGGADYVEVAPPPPRVEIVPAPRPGYFWATGHWEWRHGRHEWAPGIWLAERPGFVYSPAVWVQRDGHWFMDGGRWAPRGPDHGDHRDHHDGYDDHRGYH
jgi:hypothetical protein